MRKYIGLASIIVLAGTLFVNHWQMLKYGMVVGVILAIFAPRGNLKIIAFIIFTFCLIKFLFFKFLPYFLFDFPTKN